MNHKANVMMLAYNKFYLCKEALELFEKQNKGFPVVKKLLLDPGYPLETEDNSLKLSMLAAEYGWQYAKIENISVADNWNQAIKLMDLKEDDIILGMDPDGRPQEDGWLAAMMDVFDHSPECITVQFSQPGVEQQQHGQTVVKFGNTEVYNYPRLIAWSLGSFSVKWLNRIGGMGQQAAKYGYTEHHIMDHAGKLGAKFYILKGFHDHHLKAPDDLYTQWKLESAQKKINSDFADWLKINGHTGK